ncbi:MAG TPA: hypothetical protein VIK72_19345 [Clostridiaceae bacterium]
MEQIFIKVLKEGCYDFENHSYDKDIRETTHTERIIYYNAASKGQIINMLEKYVANQITEGEKK